MSAGNLRPVYGPTCRSWRLLRSATFAAVATALAALGHVAGGGGRPDPAVLIIGAATIGAIATGLTKRRRGWPGIFGVLAACQLAFHLLFSVDAHDTAMAGPGHDMMASSDLGRMLVFHLLAAALSALVLAKGESALFGLFSALRRAVLFGRQPAGIDLPPRWTAFFGGSLSPHAAGALLSTSPRRGPPAAR